MYMYFMYYCMPYPDLLVTLCSGFTYNARCVHAFAAKHLRSLTIVTNNTSRTNKTQINKHTGKVTYIHIHQLTTPFYKTSHDISH